MCEYMRNIHGFILEEVRVAGRILRAETVPWILSAYPLRAQLMGIDGECYGLRLVFPAIWKILSHVM